MISPVDLARRHVAEAAERVERQRKLVDKLRAQGRDTALARQVLATFETTLSLMHADLAKEERSGVHGSPEPAPRSVSPTNGRKMKSQAKAAGRAAFKLISERIAQLGDWRGYALARIRALIKEADPDVVEEWKWMGTPVWSHEGGICTGEAYKSMVKLTFFKGASLKDPGKLFNSSLDGKVRRAIDIHKGEEIDANAFKALVRAAVALNASASKKPAKRK